MASEAFQRLAFQISRRGELNDILLPPEVDTVALEVADERGRTTIEALPGGQLITMTLEME